MADVAVTDTLDFDLEDLRTFPDNMNEYSGDYTFSPADPSFFYIKTKDENSMQYALVKCGLDNKEIAQADISGPVQDFVNAIVDSGLCKSWQSCFRLKVLAYRGYVILVIDFYGEEDPQAELLQLTVFNAELKVIDSAKNTSLEYYLTKNRMLSDSDSLFMDDLKGSRLISYEDSAPSVIYESVENEMILWDRNRSNFYKAVVTGDSLSVDELFGEKKSLLKIHDLNKSSYPLFIWNDHLYLSHAGNLYLIDIRSLEARGYRITPATYNIYPSAAGFFCDYVSLENPAGAGFLHAYSFVPLANSK